MKTFNGDGQPGSVDTYRIRLAAEDHRWSFVLTAADADLMQKRVGELASDPDSPLSPADARLIGERIQQIRATAAAAATPSGIDQPGPAAGSLAAHVRH